MPYNISLLFVFHFLQLNVPHLNNTYHKISNARTLHLSAQACIAMNSITYLTCTVPYLLRICQNLKDAPSDKSHHHETQATLLQNERMQKSQDYWNTDLMHTVSISSSEHPEEFWEEAAKQWQVDHPQKQHDYSPAKKFKKQ